MSAVLGLLTSVIPLLRDKGFDAATASGIFSSFGVSLIAGRVVVGYLLASLAIARPLVNYYQENEQELADDTALIERLGRTAAALPALRAAAEKQDDGGAVLLAAASDPLASRRTSATGSTYQTMCG